LKNQFWAERILWGSKFNVTPHNKNNWQDHHPHPPFSPATPPTGERVCPAKNSGQHVQSAGSAAPISKSQVVHAVVYLWMIIVTERGTC